MIEIGILCKIALFSLSWFFSKKVIFYEVIFQKVLGVFSNLSKL